MAKSKSRSRSDRPATMEDLIARDDIRGTGDRPAQLEQLANSRFLDIHLAPAKSGQRAARGAAVKAGKLDLTRAPIQKIGSAWRLQLDAAYREGLPGLSLEQTPVRSLKVKGRNLADQPSSRPSWATVSFLPKPAESRQRHLLRRRNGRLIVPDYVIGNDDRQVYYPSTWPWFLVGRIEVYFYGAFVWSGSGALVGTNVVLTASHMVPWGAGSGNWAMKFTPGYYDGQSTQGAGVYSWTESARGYSDHDQGDDMAVLKLYTALGNSLGYFGYKTYSDDWEGGAYWYLLGYPGAVGGGVRPTWQSGIKVLDDDSDGAGVELEHNGDATDGNSGGPLWSWWGDSPRVIGTHSGSEYNWDEDNNVAAGGSALSSLIKWGRDNW